MRRATSFRSRFMTPYTFHPPREKGSFCLDSRRPSWLAVACSLLTSSAQEQHSETIRTAVCWSGSVGLPSSETALASASSGPPAASHKWLRRIVAINNSFPILLHSFLAADAAKCPQIAWREHRMRCERKQ